MARPEATEKPTPKRRGEAKKKGQVPRSSEVAPAFVFLVAVVILHLGFWFWVTDMAQLMKIAFSGIKVHGEVNNWTVWTLFSQYFSIVAPLFTVLFAVALVVGYAANVAQFGFLFNTSLLRPKFSKLNPLTGIRNVLISKQTFINLAKQVAKLLAVVSIIVMTVKDNLPTVYNSARNSPHDWMVSVEGLVYTVAWRFALFLLALALLDYAFQRWQLEESLKMTRTEIKDEMRQAESSPEAKNEVRQRQRAAARRRMMAAVPKATVVVTNPTHFACALEWDEVTMEAPVLTCKGADLMAHRIRQLAKEHGVPLVENPTLARTLYYKVELDSPVPPEMYAATAQVIAFVYRLKRKTIA
ncbi:MAG: flagellar biosynthesis protein FlhB [Candidatus Eremiobacteraeota bacterium]|nr:flagellar biosynthesis protein FlhB [Candidatus Eremiobacteraeota bacterium]